MRLIKKANAAVLNAPVEHSLTDIESWPDAQEFLTEQEMVTALARIGLPASLLREFRRWAPREQREPAYRFLMEIWNAAVDRRMQRALEIKVLGRSRDAYGTSERRGLLATAYTVSDMLLRAINEAVRWADHSDLRDGPSDDDPFIDRALQRQYSFMADALSSLKGTLPALEAAQKALQRGLNERTARRHVGRKTTTTLTLPSFSRGPVERRQIERMLRHYLLLAHAPSPRKAPEDLRATARQLAHRLVDEILSSADRFGSRALGLKEPRRSRSSAKTSPREVQEE
jgi:hypothetical protein